MTATNVKTPNPKKTPNATGAVSSKSTPVQNQKKQAIPKAEEVKAKTLEELEKKTWELVKLIERKESLTEALSKTKGFEVSTQGNGESIIVDNGDGQRFRVSNTIIVGEMANFMKAKLVEAIDKVDTEILSYS